MNFELKHFKSITLKFKFKFKYINAYYEHLAIYILILHLTTVLDGEQGFWHSCVPFLLLLSLLFFSPFFLEMLFLVVALLVLFSPFFFLIDWLGFDILPFSSYESRAIISCLKWSRRLNPQDFELRVENGRMDHMKLLVSPLVFFFQHQIHMKLHWTHPIQRKNILASCLYFM